MRENLKKHVMEAVEMEKLTDHTSNPGYLVEYTKLMAQQDSFMKQVFDDEVAPSTVILKGVGEVEVGHLRKFRHVLQNAFDLKMEMVPYWKIVLRRLIDTIALHLQLSINNLVKRGLEKEITVELMSPIGGFESLLQESPSVARKRAELNQSVQVLRESKEVLANIIDTISS